MIFIKYNPYTNLGNWLFQYAVARSVDSSVAFYLEQPVAEGRFRNLERIVPDLRFVRELPPTVETFREPLHAFTLPHVPELLLDGHFQYPDLFDVPLVRHLLRCPEDVRIALKVRYGKRMTGRVCVGVSVRRGDYLKLPHRHPFVGARYLYNAVHRFPVDALYVVCSDDIPWCRHFFSVKRFPGREFMFVENEGILEQLYIHTLCAHNIISNSTFSWWGAWLNPNPQKKVVFPARWYGPDVKESPSPLYFEGCEIVASPYSVRTFCGMVVWMARLLRIHLLKRMGLR